MRHLVWGVLVVQVLTFAVLGAWFLQRGEWRLGIAQKLLAIVQTVIYSGGIK